MCLYPRTSPWSTSSLFSVLSTSPPPFSAACGNLTWFQLLKKKEFPSLLVSDSASGYRKAEGSTPSYLRKITVNFPKGQSHSGRNSVIRFETIMCLHPQGCLRRGVRHRVLLKSGSGNRGRSACGTTHVAHFKCPCETGLILRGAGKAGNPFQTTQGNRLSCRVNLRVHHVGNSLVV